ncbi:HAUS augmin-like complex subunit 6 N-terminus-domain-containing protein [Aspergillus floccosus]
MQASKPPPRPKALNWDSPSSLAVFVRNLQLLQLDRRQDWPAISVRSLSPASHNQRQRLKAIEWALYHLVALWEPETARDKLRPFFPPLEPLQSVNLRAALFRVLSDLKKNGDLGRETILRKSMLDDCKGDKFDEILAVFSTAVLRKTLATSSDDRLRNVAVALATAPGLTRQEYQNVLPLILAHRVSLKTIGDRRNRVHATHEKFAQLLDDKKVQLDERSKENKAPISQAADADLDGLASEVKTNWLGSAEWANTLLEGGARSSSDAFLELPFSTAWARANESTVEDLTISSTPDLLVDLESRIVRQRARLHRWRQYRNSMRKHERVESMSSNSNVPLVFRDHQPLTVASVSKAVREPVERVSLKADDRALLFSMTEALARINGSPHTARTALRTPAVDSPRRVTPEPTRPATSSSEPEIPHIREDPPQDINIDGVPVDDLPRPPSSEGHDALEEDIYQPRRNPAALVERTRKSMSLLPPPNPNPRPPRESLRSRRPRASFPVNQFETPEKQHAQAYDISRASTPRDELFEEEAEYSSVFKSRPRVAHSPLASPAVHVDPVEDFGLDVETGSHDLEDEMVDSPLARRPR